MQVPRLHVIIDINPAASDPVGLARLVLAGGGRLLQVRCKAMPDRDAYEVAARIADLCRTQDAGCVINDRPDIALAVGASGCHVGALDLPVPVVRRLLGSEALVGGTARDPVTAKDLALSDVDYVGVGPIYTTSSKTGLPDPLGLGVVEAVSAALEVPVIAISGITVERVPELIRAGAYGVAVIGAIARSADPRATTFALMAALANAVGAR